MATIRGDGDVLSLLDEMSSQQGYFKTPDVDVNVDVDVDVAAVATSVAVGTKNDECEENRFRFVPEDQVSDTRTDAEGMMIWNPAVRVSLSLPIMPSASLLNLSSFPPTNPEVEVYRRRCYEKFKRKFPGIFQDVAAAPNAMNMTMDQNDRRSKAVARDGGRLWNDLSAHNILERWHFCTKLSEFLTIKERPTRFSHVQVQVQVQVQETTDAIRSLLMNQNHDNSNHSPVMDPIVVSSSSVRTTHAHDNQKRSHLENEIVFQWRREWRKKYNSNSSSSSNSKIGNGEKDPAALLVLSEQLDRFLTSTKFRKRVRKIEAEVRLLAGQSQTDFWTQLGKRAAFTATQQSGGGGGAGGHKRKRRNVPKIAFTESTEEHTHKNSALTLSMSVTYLGLTMHLNQSHYRKLQVLYDRFGSGASSSSSLFDDVNDAFASSLFCVLVRYDMLEGAGLQASMNGAVFEMLRQSFDCTMECFASPFNCWYERYCSAFPDTDAPFGSVGSFFDYDFGANANQNGINSGGCYQANPPFVSDFIERMYDRMDHFLKEKGESETTTTTQKESSPLMFIVFIPAWKETAGWKALEASPHLTLHVLLSQEQNPHYYCEGTQHRRKKSRHRIASFDTSVFFLQNALARTKWPVTNDTIDKLKHAFSLPPNQCKSSSLSTTETTETHPKQQSKQQSIHTTSDPAGSEAKKDVQRNKEEKHVLPLPSNTNTNKNSNHGKDTDTLKATKRRKQKRSTVDSEEQQLAILQGMGLALENDNVGDHAMKAKTALSPKTNTTGQKKKRKKSGKKR
eukprot:scaffold3127_cov52-Attheya_sp.AAC.2